MTAAPPFTWGIVGTGAIAQQFAADLTLVPGARIGAVCSRGEASARRFMDRTGTPKSYPALPALLADPSIDAIYVATPNVLHVPQALAALEAGKPVLVEKPLATSVRDAEQIAAAAAAADCFAMEALWTRFLPAVQSVRDMLAAGAIGKVVRVEAELAYRKEEKAGDRFFDPALGGGSALDLGVYPLSLAIGFFGTPSRVSGRWWAAGSGVDRRCDFDLSFGDVAAGLSCGFDRDGRNVFSILGSSGAIRIEAPFLKAQKVTLFEGVMRDLPLVGAGGATAGLGAKILSRLPLPGRKVESLRFPGNGLQFEAAAVMEAVRRGERHCNVMPLQQSIAVLETIERILAHPPEKG